jgi:hypothetical protein
MIDKRSACGVVTAVLLTLTGAGRVSHGQTEDPFDGALSLLRDPSATLEVLGPALRPLAQADTRDRFGMSIAMHAAALGRVDALAWLAREFPGVVQERNELRGATLMHYAAQATGGGGAEVVRWLFAAYPEQALAMANTRWLSAEGKGNGHTVTMEAVFNNRGETVRALLALRDAGLAIDMQTPALTGWTPRSFAAERSHADYAEALPQGPVPSSEIEGWRAARDEEWLAAIADPAERQVQRAGLAMFARLVSSTTREEFLAVIAEARAQGVDLDGRYGRLGGTALSTVTTPSGGRSGDLIADQCRWLLEAGADPRVEEGSLMFVHGGFRAAVFGNAAALRLILDQVRQQHGDAALAEFTASPGPMNGVPMHLDAAWRHNEEVIWLLLGAGADPDQRSFAGESMRDAVAQWQVQASDGAIQPPSDRLLRHLGLDAAP